MKPTAEDLRVAKDVVVEIPSNAIRLTGIVDIRNWLLNVELDSRVRPVSLEQGIRSR